MKYTIIFLSFLFLNIIDIISQPGPPNGFPGGNGGPPCWPPSTCETPINNELFILFLLGVLLVYIKKSIQEPS
jgi:hypothetical protein